MSNQTSKGFNAITGEVLACTNGWTDESHFYVGQDAHGNRNCRCGGNFLPRRLVEAQIIGRAKLVELEALKVR